MSESNNSVAKACGNCKYYDAPDRTCRIRSVQWFPIRKPNDYCHEFVDKSTARLDSEKPKTVSEPQLAIDKDEAWQLFVSKLRSSTKPKHRQAEKLFRQIAAEYSLTKLADFEKITSAQMLEVNGIGKQWVYALSEILAEHSIFNTTVLSRTGEQI